MRAWLETHGKAIQALAAFVTMVAAVAALIGVKVQIDANARQQREQSARDIYREFLNLSIANPGLADPDYCGLRAEGKGTVYENYVEYLLYTGEQVIAADRGWEPTMDEHMLAHEQYLCAGRDWSGDSAEVRGLITRFQARHCRKPVAPCPQP